MSELLSVEQTAELLKAVDKILILTHQYPDGDTLGSGFALCRALHAMGKAARVECSDAIPEKYGYLYASMQQSADFEPEFICAVDTADARLLGERLSVYEQRVSLCIDHHASNTHYAKKLLLIPEYAAAAMIIARYPRLGVEIDRDMAACIYTGIATDTAVQICQTQPRIPCRMAADMMDLEG